MPPSPGARVSPGSDTIPVPMSDPTPVSSIRELTRNIGNKVVLSGWLDNKRSSGKIAFLQVRCAGGTVQAVAGRKDVSDEHWAEIEKVTGGVSIPGLV